MERGRWEQRLLFLKTIVCRKAAGGIFCITRYYSHIVSFCFEVKSAKSLFFSLD